MKKFGLTVILLVLLSGIMIFVSSCSCSTNNAEKVSLEKADGSQATTNITDKDYEECQEYIDKIYDEIEKYDERDYANDQDIANAVEKVSEVAENWKKDGKVSTVNKHDSYVYIEFPSGIKYFYAPSIPGTNAVGSDTHVSVYSMQPAKSEYASRNQETKNADDNATDVSAKKIDDAYENYSWKYNLDDKDVTLKTVAGLDRNEVVLWHGHGLWFEESGSALVLSETIKDKHYFGDNVEYISNKGNYLVTAAFVDSYVKNISNTFLYLSTCSSLRDNQLAEAFKRKGAVAIVGNTDVITTIYSCQITSAVIDGLIAGKDLDSAMAFAKEKYGAQDSTIYTSEGAKGYAVPTVYCGGNYTFAEEVVSFTDGIYNTYKSNDKSGYCKNMESRDANGNKSYAAGFYEAFIEDGYLYIRGGIETSPWDSQGTRIPVKNYPYSEYKFKIADNCYFEEEIIGEGPSEERTLEQINSLLKQAKNMDALGIDLSQGMVTGISYTQYW